MPTRNTPSLEEVADAVRGRQAWGIAALHRLISIDSVAPHEAACQEALAEMLGAEGLAVQQLPLDDGRLRQIDGYIESGLPLVNRPNLVVSVGGSSDRARSLIMNSHIDTVPWQDTVDLWDVHPLSGAVMEGKLYGRGSMDAKGQVMAALVALLALKDLGYEPPGRAIVQSVVSEEPDGNGTLSACAAGVTAHAAINLEATGNQIAYGHRGILGLRYTVRGQARHGSVRRDRGNAIVLAGRLAEALDHSLDDWQHDTDDVYGRPVVNVGRVSGGEDIFTSPLTCTLDCGIRYAPGTEKAVLEHVSRALEVRLGADAASFGLVQDAIFSHFDAAGIAPDADLTRAFVAAANEVNQASRLTVFPACCDARHFINRYQIPTLIFGPGDLRAAHAENEYLDLAQWEEASRILALFVTRWCQ